MRPYALVDSGQVVEHRVGRRGLALEVTDDLARPLAGHPDRGDLIGGRLDGELEAREPGFELTDNPDRLSC